MDTAGMEHSVSWISSNSDELILRSWISSRMDIAELHRAGDDIKEMMKSEGYYSEPSKYEAELSDGNITFAYSYPIKAFEKFLGYYDRENRIAFNPSISMRTDFSFCLAACRYRKNGKTDTVVLDGYADNKYYKKAKFALDKFRSEYSINGSFDFYIKRYRRYQKAKGLSESSAVAAAVSRALISNVFGDDAAKDDIFVSRYARLVSGSGTRAAHDGISMWLSYPGMDSRDCVAFKVGKSNENLNYGVFPKYSDVATDNAHSIAVNSVFYGTWVSEKFSNVKRLISDHFDINDLLKIGENDMLRLNSILMSGGLIIQTPDSLRILKEILKFKSKNEGFYFTADTGPSIAIFSFDRSLIDEFRENVNDEYIEGSYDFKGYNNRMRDFIREAQEYFTQTPGEDEEDRL
ncbi:hypothetical protein [Thermoplasma acidophilum]|uniref:Mevalonate 3,5-bisphosphate decarboxylase n=1 Tax=Thermoplasma acidophilum (strain ATCC 25905 / DSM 1728 / JCM 9062 / NBRC 15155 / AMRC-C165) TaxID=273075 RepID=MBD_THEAC|nr:mevalonate 3,5-bisphosphate decarboxylase [Thermoplasma acidophilum]Q9HJS1.1 RecName: Full=Mevalonate 3,5-bisphosphate decarboxylase; Short=MBD; AltName: Full=Bisphosphomevalonate decarboxylase [Thermoplasma acidophilum DSM 1728]CAC12022.1 hypothetical protein [Thermoplasma acidophilum]